MAHNRTGSELTPEQQAEADRIEAALQQATVTDIRELAELLASKDDSNTFGATEFTARDIVHRIAAKAIETALQGREKGGTTGPATAAPTATNPPSSSVTDPNAS